MLLKHFKNQASLIFFAGRIDIGYSDLFCWQKQSNEPSEKVLRAEKKQAFVQSCTKKSRSPKTLGIRA